MQEYALIMRHEDGVKVKGNAVAIAEAEKLHLTGNHFYFVLLGELYLEIDRVQAKQYLDQAFALARTGADRQTIQRKLDLLTDADLFCQP
jgi:predicted RNA polymerase sigma factor